MYFGIALQHQSIGPKRGKRLVPSEEGLFYVIDVGTDGYGDLATVCIPFVHQSEAEIECFRMNQTNKDRSCFYAVRRMDWCFDD